MISPQMRLEPPAVAWDKERANDLLVRKMEIREELSRCQRQLERLIEEDDDLSDRLEEMGYCL